MERLIRFRRPKIFFRRGAFTESATEDRGLRKVVGLRQWAITRFLSKPSPRRRLVFALIGAAVVSFYLSQRGVSYSDLIVAFGSLTIGVIVFNGERGIHYGFMLWVLTLALGYRTMQLTPNLHLHPAEILLWVLMACVCVQRHLVSTSRLTFPLWMWLLMPFCVLAWWPLILGNAHWDQMLNEFRNFVLLVPLMIVATVVLRESRNWQRVLLAFFAASTWIAVLGILEFWFSSITNLFSAFMTDRNAGTIEGFERASFGFWGGPMATFVCALALPITIVAVRWYQARWQRSLIVAGAIAQVIAIYVGGYRSIWFVVVVEILLACFLSLKRQRVTVAAACLIVIVGGYQLVPQAGNRRAVSGLEALRGRPTDGSARNRIDRAEWAFDQMVAAPLGNGWSAAGWVHSDFIQVGANLGLLGGLIFLGGYLYTLGRLFQRVVLKPRAEAHVDLGITLLLSYVSVGGLLATQGVEVLPQLVLPVWFIWVLVEVWLRQIVDAREFEKTSTRVRMSKPRKSNRWWPSPLAGSRRVKQ